MPVHLDATQLPESQQNKALTWKMSAIFHNDILWRTPGKRWVCLCSSQKHLETCYRDASDKHSQSHEIGTDNFRQNPDFSTLS